MSSLDLMVVGGFIVATLVVAYLFGKDETSTDDFFLGGRRIPGWAACLSFVATEISALTIIGVPATAFKENWNYGQFVVGSALSRVAIAYWFIPVFFQYRCITIYEYIAHRFGPASHRACAIFFFMTRLMGSGVRLMAACAAVSLLLGCNFTITLVAYTIVTILFIGFGGIKAVVWNNVLQAITFLGGGVLTIAFLLSRIQGGLGEAVRVAVSAGKLEFYHAGPAVGSPGFWHTWLSDPNIFWIAVLNGLIGSMAAFGTDHDLMQRLLTVKTREISQKTMVFTILGSVATILTYLSIGSLLYVFYHQNPDLSLPAKIDEIFPHFIARVMPEGLRALMLAAIVVASIDSPLGSLAASFVTDIYRPVLSRGRDERHYLLVSRLAVGAFGLVLGTLAWVFHLAAGWLWLAFKIGGVTFGSLLGVFLLGLATRHRGDRSNVVAMVVTAALMGTLLYLSETKVLQLGWSWLIVIGTGLTMVLASVLSRFEESRSVPPSDAPQHD
ncbi:MAG: hypothetical protein HY815_22095 [Candidatus Riflebacteria bacterium]|nr:hypothetical protein [Candidatus Riflebacteria bacterium]